MIRFLDLGPNHFEKTERHMRLLHEQAPKVTTRMKL